MYCTGVCAQGREDRASVCVTQIFAWEDYGSRNDTEPPAVAKRAMAFAAFGENTACLYYCILYTAS
jgi:hypothetical protein